MPLLFCAARAPRVIAPLRLDRVCYNKPENRLRESSTKLSKPVSHPPARSFSLPSAFSVNTAKPRAVRALLFLWPSRLENTARVCTYTLKVYRLFFPLAPLYRSARERARDAFVLAFRSTKKKRGKKHRCANLTRMRHMRVG